MDFQQVMMRLNEFWADHGCLLWLPHNVQVGAGTMNPATVLRVLGPEPWNVAYVEPSVRPDDGRYGENPNRWQQYYQYQVILKPDPGNPIELYLDSLRALGIDPGKHDVRFVEDNWESPALGAWGLGWEVWLDGQEITQYTYFQQAGGVNLEPVSVEITYGLERIVMVLQGVRRFPDIRWHDGVTYGDMLLRNEIEACVYNFEVAEVDSLRQMYDLYEGEARNALARGLVLPAHDYVLKCSHAFNVLDARGAVGVTERARYFVRMRNLFREVAALYMRQREEMNYPLTGKIAVPPPAALPLSTPAQPTGEGPHDLAFEIGCEELPVADLDLALGQLHAGLTDALREARLSYETLSVVGTPRRLVALARGLVARQPDRERQVRGPQARIAYDEGGNPTRAAEGFARGQGIDVSALQTRIIDGREYVVAVLAEKGRDAGAVLAEVLPGVIAGITFPQSMRWNGIGVSFSRPLRWYLALLDEVVVPFEYAGVRSGRVTRGIRPQGSLDIAVAQAGDYEGAMAQAGILLDVADREAVTLRAAQTLAAEVGGVIPDDPDLLREVANLVECPLAIRGAFEEEYLRLPAQVLLAVMRQHQRYLPVVANGQGSVVPNAALAGVGYNEANLRLANGRLLPYFIAVANGATLDVDAVRYGNEEVLRARYADAAFFYDADAKKRLAEFTPQLDTLTFQERLGSMLDKVRRLERLVPGLAEQLGLSAEETAMATRAAALCKSDLATQLVVELTSLQGIMGRHYAELSGEAPEVARAIEEHYWPRYTGDRLPATMPGLVVGLADRLDTLVGLFAVGIRPTGAADPWGLRRAALGIVQLLVGKEVSLALPEALSEAAALLPVEVGEEVLREALEYITGRYRGYLIEGSLRYDVVDAVLAERGYDPWLAYRSLQSLSAWVAREEWQLLLDAYARCVRITRDQAERHAVDEGLLAESAERELDAAYRRAAARVAGDSSVDGLFEALIDLKPAIERFFDDVLVMTADLAVRRNRLGLLQAIGALADGIVDLSVMEGF